MIGLDPPVLGGEGHRGGAREGLQRSGPSSALGGTGRGAGARCALPAAHGGCSALHLMRLGCLSHRGARAARSHRPSNTPARARNAHNLAGQQTCWNAQTRSAPTGSPAAGTLATCLGRARRLLAPPARGRGPCPSLPRVTALGWRGRAPRFLLAFPPTTRCRAFVLPFRGGEGPPPRRSRPRVRPARTLAFRPGLFRFPSSLAWILLSLPSGPPGKVASPSLLKSSPSLFGVLGTEGCVRARSIPGARAVSAGFPPRCRPGRCSQRWLDRGRGAAGGGDG